MEAQQCVVDGQQRLNAIREFIECKLEVGSRLFSDLSSREKEEFLKYEIAVIDFDLEAGDERLKEVFHRLNRTYYSLSAIERLSSEYSSSDFLLVARVLCGEIETPGEHCVPQMGQTAPADDDSECEQYTRDPAIGEETWQWLMDHANGHYKRLLQNTSVFSKFEFDRKVPLMFTLNLMCTFISGVYYNRNDKVRVYLEDKLEYFPEKDDTINAINEAAEFISRIDLDAESIWWSKANFFSLMAELVRSRDYHLLSPESVKQKLTEFAVNLPPDYSLAAREAVGRKSQRELRGKYLRQLLLGVDD